MTAQHRAPSTHRISTKAWAITALVLVFLLVGFLAVAKAATGEKKPDFNGVNYQQGYSVGFDTGSDSEWTPVGEHRAYVLCERSITRNSALVGDELWNMAMGCRDGVLMGQAVQS